MDPRDPTVGDASRTPSRFMGWLVIAAVLAAGFAGGVAFDHGVLHRAPAGGPMGRPEMVPGAPMGRRPGPPGGRPGRTSAFDRFARDLDLTPAQVATVDSVMTGDFAAITAARETMQPRVDSIVANTRARIEAILTPAQRERYHTLLAEQARRAEAMARERGRAPK